MKVINNSDVERLVSQDEVTRTLETAYQDLFSGKAVCRPRVDVEIPSSDPDRFYRWGTMEGGCTGRYFAIRCKSDNLAKQFRRDDLFFRAQWTNASR